MKRVFISICLLLCLLSLAGCANGQPAPSGAIVSPEAPDAVSADEVAAPAAPAEKTVLRLGMIMSEDGALRNIVSEFNRTDSTYTVELVDYRESTDDQTQAETVLKTQMLSKDGPDMICFTGLSPLPWIAKGLLYDMEPLAAADGELSAETVPIWDALHEYGGLYLLGPTYYVETLGCTARFYNEHAGWTLRDFIQIESELDEGQQLLYYMSPDYFLSRFGGRYLRSALDLKNAACDLDNEDFIFILDSARKAGTFQDTDDRDRTYAQIVLNDEVFCFFEGLMSGSDVALNRFMAGDDWDPDNPFRFIGYPTPEGGGGTDIRLISALGITAGGAHIEGCWEFIRYALMHPCLINNSSGMPTYAPLTEDYLAVVNSLSFPYEITGEDMQTVIDVARTSRNLLYYDEDALAIILDEAQDMFAGNATPEETAKNIQARVSLYMLERYG